MKTQITKLQRISNGMLLILGVVLGCSVLLQSCSKEEIIGPASPATSANQLSNSDQRYTLDDGHISPIPGMTEKASGRTIPEGAMIYIRHGACFGLCPVYTVSLSPNGEVVYTGYQNVRVVGTVKYSVGEGMASALSNMMIANGFLKLENNYPFVVNAAQTLTGLRTIKTMGNVKVVVDYGYGIPENLIEIRRTIEDKLGIDKLVNAQPDPVPFDLPSSVHSAL